MSILYDRSRNARYPILILPLRMDEQVYISEPVFTCIFNRKSCTLIVDDLVAMNGVVLNNQPAYDRILAVHDMIHNLYRPDHHLLPMKIEVRRYFAYSQLGECLDMYKKLEYPSKGISVKPTEMMRREMIAVFPASCGSRSTNHKMTSGTFTVIKGDAPDLYYVNNGQETQPLVVKTLKDSQELIKRFKSSSNNSIRMDLDVKDGKFFIK